MCHHGRGHIESFHFNCSSGLVMDLGYITNAIWALAAKGKDALSVSHFRFGLIQLLRSPMSRILLPLEIFDLYGGQSYSKGLDIIQKMLNFATTKKREEARGIRKDLRKNNSDNLLDIMLVGHFFKSDAHLSFLIT